MYSSNLLIQINKQIGQDGSVLKHNELESCFASVDYYDTEIEKVCSISRSIALNHPFKDGNKRTAIWFVLSYLVSNDDIRYDSIDKDKIVEFAVLSVTKHYSVQEWVDFFKSL